MKKLFTPILLCLVSGLLLPFSLKAEQSLLTYTDGLNSFYEYDGIKVNADYRVGVAVKFSADKLAPFAGGTIKSIELGWSTRSYVGEVDIFLRNDLKGPDLMNLSGSLRYDYTDFGVNVIPLDEPYVIPAQPEDLYIGYYVDLKKDIPSIPYMVWGSTFDDYQYITNLSFPAADGSEDWIELLDETNGNAPTRPLFISAWVEIDEGSMNNLVEITDMFTGHVFEENRAINGIFRMRNNGNNRIDNITLTYDGAGVSSSEVITLNQGIAPHEEHQLTLPTYGFGNGMHSVTVSAVNGQPVDNVKSFDYSVLFVPKSAAQQYRNRKVLIEYYTCENEYRSPRYYDDVLKPSIEDYYKRDNLVLVSQHMQDQFMLGEDEATYMYLDFVNYDYMKVYCPMYSADRTYQPSVYDNRPDCPIRNLYYPETAYMLFDPALETPAFSRISIATEASDDIENLGITVSGRVEPGILPQGEKPFVTVYVVEDNVLSDSQEFPEDPEFLSRYPDGIYPQPAVIRERLTAMWGDEIAEGDFSLQFSARLYNDYVLDNLRIVAFVHRGQDNDPFERNVLCVEEHRPGLTGIETIVTPGGQVKAEAWFDLQGRPVVNPAEGGIYFLRQTMTDGSVRVNKVVR